MLLSQPQLNPKEINFFNTKENSFIPKKINFHSPGKGISFSPSAREEFPLPQRMGEWNYIKKKVSVLPYEITGRNFPVSREVGKLKLCL